MKHHKGILSLILILAPLYIYSSEITIIHTGDTHSHIEPYEGEIVIPYFDQLNPVNGEIQLDVKGRGGLIKIARYIKETRDQNTLVIDSGDLFQGTAYYNLFRGEVEVGIYNNVGYDYITLGNHEYDSGINELVRVLKEAKFKIIVSNYDFRKTELRNLVKEYDVIERNGIKIGIIGISPNVTHRREVYTEGKIKYRDPIKSAKKVIKFLKKRHKVDLIISINHIGYKGEKGEPGDLDFKYEKFGVDMVILGGHSHTIMNRPEIYKKKNGETLVIDHSGFFTLYLSKFTVAMNNKKIDKVR